MPAGWLVTGLCTATCTGTGVRPVGNRRQIPLATPLLRQDDSVPTDIRRRVGPLRRRLPGRRPSSRPTWPTTGRTSRPRRNCACSGTSGASGCSSWAAAAASAPSPSPSRAPPPSAWTSRPPSWPTPGGCASEEEVRVELRSGDLADLAFLRADSIDLVFSAYAFGYVEDLNRVFRQVHRVLKVGAPLVFSLPHPAYDMIDDDADRPRSCPPLLLRPLGRSTSTWGGVNFTAYHHTFAELYMGLARASYRVDLVLEPEPVTGAPRSHAGATS